ncbi:hypothetical protein HUN59_04680 [Curtobacterium sp. Csp2]|uniref:hypothetical protein n=1 Tax=Curtobacterium sp. Csp2 TaxID=2495430 RepID=UPI001580B022|nr:hypothetical protein [Curtobacterium sp. Csp2]QKS15606.1 hypothetical protein HUN59_04680 [Curtobacterium sp. Csp2]
MDTLVVVTVALVVLVSAVLVLAYRTYRTTTWHALRQVKRGVIVHLPTDPVCRHHHHVPAPGTRLHRAAAGVPCPVCDRPETDSPW